MLFSEFHEIQKIQISVGKIIHTAALDATFAKVTILQIKIKSSLCSLIPFRLLRVSKCPTPQLCARAHTLRLLQWRVVGNV